MSRTGTVSHILWHFTGGSRVGAPKPPEIAVSILKAILASKTVKRGNERETLSLTIPLPPAERGVTWETDSVVCLADIPIQLLGYHASHYGKVAIGFKRQSAIESGFSPVLYCSDKSAAMIQWINIKKSSDLVRSYLKSEIDTGVESNQRLDAAVSLSSILVASLERFEMLFKNYSLRDQHSAHIDRILNEREWRLLEDYEFSIDDISMIIVPEEGGYYADFVSNRERLGINNLTVIVPWETLNIS